MVWADRVLETTATTGTGALALDGAVAGYQAFSQACTNGDTVYYAIVALRPNGTPSGAWETGLGTYSAANQLTRTIVHESSNGGAAVNFGAGTKQVMLTATAAKFGETINLKNYGAKCDYDPATGVGTDDTAAVQAAVAAAVAQGKALHVSGICRVTAPIVCAAAVSITGDGCQAETSTGSNVVKPLSGSWFFLDHTGIGFYCRDDAAVGVAGLVTRFENIGTFRSHAAPTGGWTPTVHAEDFRIEFRVHLNNVFMLNPYIGAKVRSGGVLWANRLYGQPLFTGIEIERSSDANNYEQIHFWPFWTQDSNVLGYTLDNAACIRVRRCDGLKASKIFSYGYHRTILAQDVTADGSGFAGFSINDIYADKCGGAVEINSDFYAAYGSMSGVIVNSDSAVGGSGPGILIAGSVASQINILGLQVTRAHDEAVKVHEAAHVVTVQPIKVEDWDRLAGSKYAFVAENGAAIHLLSIPKYSATPTLLYSQGSTGIINLPSQVRHDRSLVSLNGFQSSRQTIADDGVATLTAPTADKTVLLMVTPMSVPGAGNPAGVYWLRCSGSPSATAVSVSTTANVDVGTGTLTGTTGTDGNLRINAANDGKIYIENRTGTSKAFSFTMLGS